MEQQESEYPWRWTLAGARFTKDKGKVFSCFACGGGSTMGYKLAGYDVIGCNEIDPRMMELYTKNHKPRLAYTEPIQTFKNRNDLPTELYRLDILDGSPPCSAFSTAGLREKVWGKMRKFREGQAEQVLDTLFFDFIELAAKLQPKVVVAENVKGLLVGNARDYLRRIHEGFDRAGYHCRHFLLEASRMGVPQYRERVFFLCLRKDLAAPFLTRGDLFTNEPQIDMEFRCAPIPFGLIQDGTGRPIHRGKFTELWNNRCPEDKDLRHTALRIWGKNAFYSHRYAKSDKVMHTLVANPDGSVLYDKPVFLSDTEAVAVSTFPTDCDFCGRKTHYVCGMSVPPVMMAQVADRVHECWLGHPTALTTGTDKS